MDGENNMCSKFRNLFIVVLAIVAIATLLVACNDDQGQEGQGTPVETEYIIQYTDDSGTHILNVKSGEPYALDSVPTRVGHIFLGLYDAEQGGTQYVNVQGASLAPFSDNKNLVLFPQFEAKEYTLILEYGEADVTDVREMTIAYGSSIASLPTDLTAENKEFMGWYTKPNREGIQIADKFGIRPDRKLLTEENFDISNPNGYIYIYAGFRGEMHTVTFYFEDGMAPEEMEIEYGTSINDIVTETRVDGKAVLTWSREPNDEDRSAVFNGRVEGDMVLYALDYAPAIDFDANGGDEVTSIIARTGSAIVLPEAVREDWQFAGWYTADGIKFTATTMPSDSVELIAKWNPMLIFDERGGTLVDDIAAEQGTRVTLPETEKDGYIFAGWYTEQGDEYTSTAMPVSSTKLEARYFKTILKKYTIVSADDYGKLSTTQPSFDDEQNYNILDLSELYDAGIRHITITAHYKARYIWSSRLPDVTYIHMNYYTQQVASERYKVWEYSDNFQRNDDEFHDFSHSTSLGLTSPKLYIAKFMSDYSTWTGAIGQGEVLDFWIEVEYPDMSQLY